MAKKTKSAYFVAMTEAQIIDAVKRVKNPGSWRYATWIHDIFTIGASKDEIVITYEKSCRIGLDYSKMASVIEAKKKEDESIGTPKDRRESSYIRLKDESGNLIDPVYIVRSRNETSQKFLQVMKSNQRIITINEHGEKVFGPRKTIVRYYKNGVEIDPEKNVLLMKVIEATRKAEKPKTGPVDTWVLPFDKVLKIR